MNAKAAEHQYVTTPAEFAWLPGARAGIARLAAAGYLIAVVSNQRGVARGLVHPSTLVELEARIQNDLRPFNCAINAFRYCVHDVDVGCSCRKPEPGMILALAEELDVELANSWMVGDTESDVRAGAAAGCRTALIGLPGASVSADVTVRSLDEASRTITSPARTRQPDRG